MDKVYRNIYVFQGNLMIEIGMHSYLCVVLSREYDRNMHTVILVITWDNPKSETASLCI